MEMISFEVPMMYGDHHVVEVRQLLGKLPGIHQIYASSSFHVVEVQFDTEELNGDQIKAELEAAGYLGELALPVETGTTATEQDGRKPYFRQTAVLAQTGEVASFAQKVSYEGRPLWPCPGIGK